MRMPKRAKRRVHLTVVMDEQSPQQIFLGLFLDSMNTMRRSEFLMKALCYYVDEKLQFKKEHYASFSQMLQQSQISEDIRMTSMQDQTPVPETSNVRLEQTDSNHQAEIPETSDQKFVEQPRQRGTTRVLNKPKVQPVILNPSSPNSDEEIDLDELNAFSRKQAEILRK